MSESDRVVSEPAAVQHLISGTEAPAARPVAEPLWKKCFAEFFGTAILVLFGDGAVHTAVLTGAQSGIWQVAIIWGVAVMLVIYAVGAVSGAHINPAITLAFAVRGKFAWSLVAPYIVSQMAGAFAAAALLLLLFNPFLTAKEKEKHVVRGQPGSQITATCYCEYFPAPGGLAGGTEPWTEEAQMKLDAMVSEPIACLSEIVATMFLALVVFALTDDRNTAAPAGRMAPAFIGLTVAFLISVIGPLTQCCMNPGARFRPSAVRLSGGLGLDRDSRPARHGLFDRVHNLADHRRAGGIASLRPRAAAVRWHRVKSSHAEPRRTSNGSHFRPCATGKRSLPVCIGAGAFQDTRPELQAFSVSARLRVARIECVCATLSLGRCGGKTMTRVRICIVLAAALVLWQLVFVTNNYCGDSQAAEPTAAKSPRPNVVIFLADDMGYSDCGCYGGEIATPNIDRLAAGGLRFTQFYNTARCWPSRAALLTGYYAQEVRRDSLPGVPGAGGNGVRPAWARLLPAYLKELGYRTYHSGKWHVDGPVLAGGFDHSYALYDYDRNFYPRQQSLDDHRLPPVKPGTGFYTTTAIAQHAIDILAEHQREFAGKPFFLYCCFTVPHFPLQAPPEDIALYKNRYIAGWDALRAERHDRMLKMGIVNCPLSKLDPEDWPRWNLSLRQLQQKIGPEEVGRGCAVGLAHRRAEKIPADQDSHSCSHGSPHGHGDRPRRGSTQSNACA